MDNNLDLHFTWKVNESFRVVCAVSWFKETKCLLSILLLSYTYIVKLPNKTVNMYIYHMFKSSLEKMFESNGKSTKEKPVDAATLLSTAFPSPIIGIIARSTSESSR
mmetsp:Transcript_17174/g.37570  ORF Transcript_17174/g.37570 Transcript_17174/m.37570 type:complete len:107 (+) Transcript_17174:223-543(+)